eukprot:COSAG06_NODE_556_length_14336_cov_8.683290_2_plen_41_part_00
MPFSSAGTFASHDEEPNYKYVKRYFFWSFSYVCPEPVLVK